MIRMWRAAVAAGVVVLGAQMAFAGPVENACNTSDRDAANGQVCACMSQVADIALTGAAR
jgi:hypothetical protein